METGFRSTFRSLLKASVACGVLVAACGANAAERAAILTAESSASVDEVVVVGSRLNRQVDGPAPVTVIDRAEIDRTGVSNLADLVRYVPQVSFLNEPLSTPPGARAVQLRGLAAGTTLVLINGRRAVPGALSTGLGFFDLNSVPLSAVERIEILADSASAVYGADAVGGVVNIVLKSTITAPTLDLSYGSADGGADERRVSLSVGGSSERARGMVVVDYFRRGALLGADRAVTRNNDYSRFGSQFGGINFTTSTSNPGNICAVTGNLPGLTTPCAAVPVGSSGVGLTPTDFAATAGKQNRDSQFAYFSIVPPTENYSAVASGSVDLSDQVSVFGEFMYADRTTLFYGIPGTISQGLVPANNPFNPFGVAVRADFRVTGLGSPVTTAKDKTYRETAGLKGRYRKWDWEVSYTGVQDDAVSSTAGNLDTARALAALAQTSPSLALNPFQDGAGGSIALLSSLLQDPSVNRRTSSSHVDQVSGFVRGDLMALPAGPLQIVAGSEWRHEAVSLLLPGSNFVVPSNKANRNSSSAFAELRIPVIGVTKHVPIAGEITATLAGRYDNYSDFGDTFNAQYGLEWRPTRSLLLRSSYGESFRAPNLYDLYQPSLTQGPTVVIDPRRNNESGTAQYRTGGNSDLNAESSTSYTVGAVWTPQAVGRPRFSVSYWRIKQAQRVVSGFSIPTLIANEAYLPGRVTRAEPSPTDIAAGRPGRITVVDIRLLNLGRLETSGVDFEAKARFDTLIGWVSPAFTATWVGKYEAADFATSPVVDRVGRANTSGTIPTWKAVGSLGWERNGAALSGTVRYVGAYDDAGLSNVRTGTRIKPPLLFDLQGSLDLEKITLGDQEFTRGFLLRVGVTNLFDKSPKFSANTPYGYDVTQADIRQRFIYASVSKRF